MKSKISQDNFYWNHILYLCLQVVRVLTVIWMQTIIVRFIPYIFHLFSLTSMNRIFIFPLWLHGELIYILFQFPIWLVLFRTDLFFAEPWWYHTDSRMKNKIHTQSCKQRYNTCNSYPFQRSCHCLIPLKVALLFISAEYIIPAYSTG